MMRFPVTVLLLLLCAGCAQISSIPDAQHWADAHRWELRSGQMSWVQFYSGIRAVLGPENSNPIDSIARHRADTMVLVAEAYEAGRVSMADMLETEKEQLDGMQADIDRDAAQKEVAAARRDRIAAVLQQGVVNFQNQEIIDNMTRPQVVIVH